jgi:pimeloyl-ACP methyl ester carboxylesterase
VADGERTIVMVHGAFAGAWCFDRLRPAFTDRGWTCDAIDLPRHGGARADADRSPPASIGEYRHALVDRLRTYATPPIVLGHSMGAVLAQQAAALGLARALVLVCPAPRAGMLPATDGERAAAQGLMTLGAFWTTWVHPSFEVASTDSLNCMPPAERRAVFDRFGPESGQALFELFFWMLDGAGATVVDTSRIACPVLAVAGGEDRVVSPVSVRATAAGLRAATVWDVPGHGHMLLVEPGVEALAARIAVWCDAPA